MRLVTACVDLAMMVAPIAIALAIVVGTLFAWPGAYAGLMVLIVVGWLCAKYVERLATASRG